MTRRKIISSSNLASELIDAFIGKVVAVIGRAAQDFIPAVFDVRKIDSGLSLIIRPGGDYIPLFSMRHPENLFSFASMEEISGFNGSLIKFSILLQEPVGLPTKNSRCHPP
jgi:hypothetical protein